MSFCNISNELQKSSTTVIDNLFIADYLPHATPKWVEIYIYGLYLSQNEGNNISDMAKQLGVNESEIINAYKYWESQNLIQIINKEPLEVLYLPVKTASIVNKKFNPNKYKDFNKQVLSLLPDRVITPSEFNEYYSLIENEGIEPSALVMIIKYCADKKGHDVGYKYIITVAQNYAIQNIRTLDQVAEKISNYSKHNEEIAIIFKALKITREIEFDDIQLYTKWTEQLGYTHEAILFAAKKQKGKGGMKKLDAQIEAYRRTNVFAPSEIEDYESKKENLYQLTYKINRTLGVYYDMVDNIVDTYTSPWMEMGFSEDALETIASYCFKHSIKTLEGMNTTIEKFYQKGLLTSEAINQQVETLLASDKDIQKVLDKLSLARNITSNDRRSYKTWKELWNFSDELIMHAAEISKGTANPIAYMNKVLSIWLDKKITTVEQAKKATTTTKKVTANGKQREYTKEELKALFDDLDNIQL